jgi:hypothetical protein
VTFPGQAQLVVAAEIVDAGFVALLFRVDLAVFTASPADHSLDPHITEAYAYLINPQGQSQLLGMLAEGTLHLETSGTSPAAPVTGTVEATLYGIF